MAVIEQPPEEILTIPAYLAYEEMDGEAIPYKGYREVLAGNKKPEDIMGSSSLQAAVVYIIGLFLGNNLDREKYLITSNESGLHLGSGNNLTNDLAFFDKKTARLDNKYFNLAPKVVIEVDNKADLSETSWKTETNYLLAKSQKMLDFGVKKIVWVFTQNKKIFVSDSGGDWRFFDFNQDIPLLDGCVLNMAKLLANEEIEL